MTRTPRTPIVDGKTADAIAGQVPLAQTVRMFGKWPAPFDQLVDERITPPKPARCPSCALAFTFTDYGFAATILMTNVGGFRPHYSRRFWHIRCFGVGEPEKPVLVPASHPRALKSVASAPTPPARHGTPVIDWSREPLSERERRQRAFLLNAKSPEQLLELRVRLGPANIASDLARACADVLSASDSCSAM
jgi:hypothetical protein